MATTKTTKRDLLKHIQQGRAKTILGSREPEVVILRGHALVEAGLFTLLAGHLRVETTDLPPRITFETVARIALARPDHAPLRDLVLALNEARNSYAHAVEPDTGAIIQAFISKVPAALVAAGRSHGATDVEIAAGAISFILQRSCT